MNGLFVMYDCRESLARIGSGKGDVKCGDL